MERISFHSILMLETDVLDLHHPQIVRPSKSESVAGKMIIFRCLEARPFKKPTSQTFILSTRHHNILGNFLQ
jgi:hypothetical protein